MWDPTGFRDVGMLLWREKSQAGQPGDSKLCSFVRLSANFAATAAHCVISSRAGEPIRQWPFGTKNVEAIALLPKLDGSKPSPVDCYDKPDSCGYFVLSLKATAILPDAISWPSNSVVPAPDLALLSLPFVGAPSVKSAISRTAVTDRITLAGYGRTDAKFNAFESGTLLVGWQTKPPSLDSGELVWSVDIRNGEATGCNGDSGGAVFDGDLSGLPSEQPVLAGVISWAQDPKAAVQNAIDKCTSAPTGHAVRLDSHYAWLCKKSNNAIRGCTAQ